MKAKYQFYGDRQNPPITTQYRDSNLPADINDDPEIVGVMNAMKTEPEGKAFVAMMDQFRKRKKWGFVMDSLNGREIVKFHFMHGVVVRKEIRMWADGWSYQDLKDRMQKLHGILIGIPECMVSSLNEMVSMRRSNGFTKEEF